MEHLPELVEPVGGATLMEQAYHRLKRDIIELRRPPGDRFTEQQVAEAWGFSKTPVREALARLHRDGLVQPIRRAGYVVAPVTLADAAELCDMRTLLQGEAAARCAASGLPPERLFRLQALSSDDGYGQLAGPHLSERLKQNFEFEAIIANGAGHERLAAAIADIFDEIERIVRITVQLAPALSADRTRARHAIVTAIESGDAKRAGTAMRTRAESAKREILDALALSPGVASAPITVTGS
ncbi:GntR family transcriptional regulator [Amycolatopsis jiangsuensis]|uniref:DNA-binding GntR family transcriptional regulator n=1 Tax=Amycolatopsis jiangsuensis TaxID=1181879 RepID=A0A840ISB6_9PSEU|nr:GntR family transcriptional regulator [Amycolatopsis jiangsuensis]MBB4684048.1 DNA-binding GntR family transcriptional regulator [Amycolatopsis jiangsuensis]